MGKKGSRKKKGQDRAAQTVMNKRGMTSVTGTANDQPIEDQETLDRNGFKFSGMESAQ